MSMSYSIPFHPSSFSKIKLPCSPSTKILDSSSLPVYYLMSEMPRKIFVYLIKTGRMYIWFLNMMEIGWFCYLMKLIKHLNLFWAPDLEWLLLVWSRFLLSSIFYARKKYWNRKNFQLLVFNKFTLFGMFWTRFQYLYKMSICLCVTQILCSR